MSCGNDTSVNGEFFGKCTQSNIIHKAFLNELSSCKQTSIICFKTEMAQLDKEKRENNIRL